MTKRTDQQPATVPFAATPAGQPPSVAEWANRLVWTDRMLAALAHGVRGGRWHTLSDKVYQPDTLRAASISVLANQGAAGVDGQTVQQFDGQLPQELQRLEEDLRTDVYRPHAVRRVWIPKPGSTEKRPLGIPSVRDRVVQTALLHVLEPIFDHTFAEDSYGFRRGRGCHHALERVEALLNEGYVYVVDADLKSYFDTIPKDRLMERVREKVSDSRVLRWVQMFLDQGVMDGLREWSPETGTPQGAVITPPTILRTAPVGATFKRAGWHLVHNSNTFDSHFYLFDQGS
jgi:RNA-directed DNA polymerase